MWTPTIALLPGALTIYLGFDGGGYFPPATGVACAALALALVLRLTLADRPLEGFGLGAALVTGALGLFAVWSLVSTAWSDAPARAVAEFDRALLYMLTLALLATLPIVFATHLACSAREHIAARVTAAAVLPLLAATLFFTFSRASIVVMV